MRPSSDSTAIPECGVSTGRKRKKDSKNRTKDKRSGSGKGAKDSNNSKDSKDNKDSKENKDSKDSKDIKNGERKQDTVKTTQTPCPGLCGRREDEECLHPIYEECIAIKHKEMRDIELAMDPDFVYGTEGVTDLIETIIGPQPTIPERLASRNEPLRGKNWGYWSPTCHATVLEESLDGDGDGDGGGKLGAGAGAGVSIIAKLADLSTPLTTECPVSGVCRVFSLRETGEIGVEEWY